MAGNPVKKAITKNNFSEKVILVGVGYDQENRRMQVALRAMLPVNRSPQNDINRYSLEIGYQVLLW